MTSRDERDLVKILATAFVCAVAGVAAVMGLYWAATLAVRIAP